MAGAEGLVLIGVPSSAENVVSTGCSRCGRPCELTPPMHQLLKDGARIVCGDCVRAHHPSRAR